jgi:PadR family transcriptional regulator PadR
LKYQSKEYWASLIKMSLSRFFILHVLYKNQLHGYEITKRVAGITCGCCAPTEGSLYPVLKEFVDNGLVNVDAQVVSGRERKVYTITAEGRQAYVVGAQAWTEVSQYILQAVNSENL